MTYKIAIIIVGYNSQKYLAECLKSIFQSTYKNFKVIFVDNKSQDNSIRYIEKYFPQVLLIKNQLNHGFAKANNLGIKKAFRLGARYCFILNPDTILDKNCLKLLLKKANQETILQPLILLYRNSKKTKLINTSGNVLHYLGFSWCGDYLGKQSKFKGISEKEIAGASGAGMLIPSAVIKKIGYFDEGFFMYHEDLDLCWRARMAGYNVKVIPQAILWHKYYFGKNKKKFYFTERNRLRFVLKNYEFRTILLILPVFLISEILIILYSFFSGWFLEKLRSYWSFAKNIRTTLQAKTKIDRTIRDHQLSHFLSGELNFSEIEIPFTAWRNILYQGYWKIIRRLI